MYFRIPIVILFIIACLAGFAVLKGNLSSTAVANGHPLENATNTEEVIKTKGVDLTNGTAAIHTITARDLHAHVDFLADDLLEGRDTNSRGIRVAARYIAAHFERNGLQPVGEGNTYYQPVHLRERIISDQTQLSVEIDGEMIPLKYNEDFIVTTLPNQSGIKISAEMVFSGFGITAEEYEYDDFKEESVKNKFSVYVSGEPYFENDSSFFKGKDAVTRHSRRGAKSKAAIAAGAIGTIGIITHERLSKYSWSMIQRYLGRPKITLSESGEESNAALPGIYIHPDAVELILAGSMKDYDTIDKEAASGRLKPFKLNRKAELTLRFKSDELVDNNVVGYLEGSDPELKSEVIVITAHYDHLGVGTVVQGDSIYNGAADNASGTSSMLELAEAFGQMATRPKRSLLFLAVTAEEKGLLGSEYYVNNPIFPISKTIANFNIDMIGIGDSTAIVLIGQEMSSLGKTLATACEQVGLIVQPDDMPEQRIFYRSDHYNFAKKGIPAIFPSFAMKRTDFPEFSKFYHKPQDDINWNWFNFNTMEKQIQAVFLAVLSVANADNSPEWETGVEFAKYRNSE